ncbi:MAG TPA: TadE/TadG family type IV pilus assembly protein [Abditibacteriaceae bacterium]|jgi:competence protein ComGC
MFFQSRHPQKFIKHRRGATLLEFALVLPILLLLLLGIIEFGWLMRNNAVIANAAREGARSAAMGQIQANIYERVVQAAQPLFKTDATGTVTNGDISMDQSIEGPLFPTQPNFSPFPSDYCPSSYEPSPETPGSHAKTQPPVRLLPLGTEPPGVVLLADKPPKPPRPTPTPVPTPTPTPTPIITPTPTATPTGTPEPVPTPGATPTPQPDDGGALVPCRNSVQAGYIVRVTVSYQHQPLTGFFPFLRGRVITVTQSMRRDESRA